MQKNMKRKLKLVTRSILQAVAYLGIVSGAGAQIVTDGSVGPAVALQGPAYEIPDTLGSQVGPNLFHSFSHFGLDFFESATFTSAFPGFTENVIARVTGSAPSQIDGFLQSSVPGADFWLLNPNGILIGSTASISVPAGLHLSSADYMLFEDNARFGVDEAQQPKALLTSARPSAFGFFAGDIGRIVVDSQVLRPQVLQIAGGDVTIRDSSIGRNPDPEVNLGGRDVEVLLISSIAGAGELYHETFLENAPDRPELGKLKIEGSELYTLNGAIQGGVIEIDDSHLLSHAEGTSLGGFFYGNLYISAADISIRNSQISAGESYDLPGSGFFGIPGQNLSIGGELRSDFTTEAAKRIRILDSQLYTFSDPVNVGTANISLKADMVEIDGFLDAGVPLISEFAGFSRIATIVTEAVYTSDFFGLQIAGDAGDITILADDVTINNAFIYGTSPILGVPGDLIIAGAEMSSGVWRPADTVSLIDTLVGNPDTGVFGGDNEFGVPGSTQIQAKSITLRDTAILQYANTLGGGDVYLFGDEVELHTSSLFTSTSGLGSAQAPQDAVAGSVVVAGMGSVVGELQPAKRIQLADRTLVGSSSGDTFPGAGPTGSAGSIILVAHAIDLVDGVLIGAGANPEQNVFDPQDPSDSEPRPEDPAASGPIIINAETLRMIRRTAIAAGTETSGDAGPIYISGLEIIDTDASRLDDVVAGDRVGLVEIFGGTLTTDSSSFGNAGDIVIRADRLSLAVASIQGNSSSGIEFLPPEFTPTPPGDLSELFPSPEGGSIRLDVREGHFLASFIEVNGTNFGPSGSIVIEADSLDLDNSFLSATASIATGGEVRITISEYLSLVDSSIRSTATGLERNDTGGSVNISGVGNAAIALNESFIDANANVGSGGVVEMAAPAIIASVGSEISATSTSGGVDGAVLLIAERELAESLVEQEPPDISIPRALERRCTPAELKERSSLRTQTVAPGSILSKYLQGEGSVAGKGFAMLDCFSESGFHISDR